MSTFSITVSGTPTLTAEAGTPVGAAFLVQRSTGNATPSPAAGQTVTISVTAGGGSLGGATTATVTTGADGIATAEWQLGLVVGTQTIRAAPGSGSGANLAVEATQPPATALVLITAPGTNVVTGNPLNPQPVIQLRDRRATNVPQAGVVVTATIETGGGKLVGTTTATTSGQGTATFTDLTIAGALGPQVLRFTAAPNGSPLSVSSGVIQVSPPPELVLATGPSANHTLRFTATGFDPLLRHYRGQPSVPTGVPLVSDDNGAGGTGALRRFLNPILDANGVDFTVEATSATAGGVGAYTLAITVGPEHYSAPPATPVSR